MPHIPGPNDPIWTDAYWENFDWTPPSLSEALLPSGDLLAQAGEAEDEKNFLLQLLPDVIRADLPKHEQDLLLEKLNEMAKKLTFDEFLCLLDQLDAFDF